MGHLTQDHKTRKGAHIMPNLSDHHYTHTRDDSTSSTHTELSTNFGGTITDASTRLTSPTIITSQVVLHQHQHSAMTTYYQYDQHGNVLSASLEDSLAQVVGPESDHIKYAQVGDVVGAYLSRRDIVYRASVVSDHSHVQSWPVERPINPPEAFRGMYNAYPGYHAPESSDSYHHQKDRCPDHAGSFGYAGFVSQSDRLHPYPNPEHIRHLHTLHSLLPHLQPERKLNALDGMAMDIVEEQTGIVFAHKVPKKMLVLFLGRKVIDRFVNTVGRKDDTNWCKVPKVQELRIPRGYGSTHAFRILVAWMSRACRYHTMGCMKQFNVPHNTFAACTLAQILTLFGLHKDAMRVEHMISQDHFHRPIFAKELERLWNCLGEDNRYTYAVIKTVGQRLTNYEKNSPRLEPKWKEMLELLEEYPLLQARVRDLDLNERHRPVFDTEWCKKPPHKYRAHNSGPTHGEVVNGRSGSNFAHNSESATPGSGPSLPVDAKAITGKLAILRIVPGKSVMTPTEPVASEVD
jgi:hypothetical protein